MSLINPPPAIFKSKPSLVIQQPAEAFKTENIPNIKILLDKGM